VEEMHVDGFRFDLASGATEMGLAEMGLADLCVGPLSHQMHRGRVHVIHDVVFLTPLFQCMCIQSALSILAVLIAWIDVTHACAFDSTHCSRPSIFIVASLRQVWFIITVASSMIRGTCMDFAQTYDSTRRSV
jgi:hypothetical protein